MIESGSPFHFLFVFFWFVCFVFFNWVLWNKFGLWEKKKKQLSLTLHQLKCSGLSLDLPSVVVCEPFQYYEVIYTQLWFWFQKREKSLGVLGKCMIYWFLMFTLTYIQRALFVNGTWHINPQCFWLYSTDCWQRAFHCPRWIMSPQVGTYLSCLSLESKAWHWSSATEQLSNYSLVLPPDIELRESSLPLTNIFVG